jgi:hypothetical protein
VKKRTGISLLGLKFSSTIKNIHKLIALGSDCEKISVGIEATAVMATGCGFW